MATINLRDYYPFYHHDVFVEIPDDLLDTLDQWDRDDEACLRPSGQLAFLAYWHRMLHLYSIIYA